MARKVHVKEAAGAVRIPFDAALGTFSMTSFEQVVESTSWLRGKVDYLDFQDVLEGCNERGRAMWNDGKTAASTTRCGWLCLGLVPCCFFLVPLPCLFGHARGMKYAAVAEEGTSRFLFNNRCS